MGYPTTSKRPSTNGLTQQSGGLRERDLHIAGGLRNAPLHMALKSDLTEVGSFAPGLQATPLAADWADMTTIGTVPLSIQNNGQLGVPTTLCFTVVYSAVGSPQRYYQFRVTGIDTFGQLVEETLPLVSESDLTATHINDGFGATNAIRHQQWTSKVFAQVLKVECRTGVSAITDAVHIGACHQFERSEGYAQLFHDHTGGTFDLTVRLGGAAQTASAIAYNVTAAALQTALEGLSNVPAGGVRVTAQTVTGYTPQAWLIEWLDPIIGPAESSGGDGLELDGTSLTGGTNAILTSHQRLGLENVGVGLPLHLLSSGPDRGGDLYPELQGLMVIDDDSDVDGHITSLTITAHDDAADTISFGSAHGLKKDEKVIVVINNATSMTPAVNLTCLATAVDSDTLELNVDIASGVGGTATFMLPRKPQIVPVSAVTGTHAAPTSAGYRLGRAASGYDAEPNKLALYTDGRAGYALTGDYGKLRYAIVPSDLPSSLTVRGPVLSGMVRSSDGTARRALSSASYPR